jgi:hypothetical protein
MKFYIKAVKSFVKKSICFLLEKLAHSGLIFYDLKTTKTNYFENKNWYKKYNSGVQSINNVYAIVNKTQNQGIYE